MADELDLAVVSNLDVEKLSLNFDEPDHAIGKDGETSTPVAYQETDKGAVSDGSNFVEVDDAIIKDDEFQSLLKSLAPPEIDMSVFDNLLNDFDTHINDHDIETLHTCLASIESDSDDDYNYWEELGLDNNNEGEFESLQALLAPIENDKCASDDFTFDGNMEHINNCSNHHNRTKDETLKDICTMVSIGLRRGDFRKDQLGVTSSDGAQRIAELAYWYKIPLRSAPGERIRLNSDTLTFVRAIACFPHMASSLLYKTFGMAKNGANSGLASKQLPDAMKHSGFPGLIPKCCDPYLMKAYLFSHTAYMVEFGKLINPGDKRGVKAIALNQLEYSKAGVEKLPYDDEFRVAILRVVGLTDPAVFKKIIDVCNNVCKVVDEPELTWETAEKNHIKNNMICFFEDHGKDVAVGEQVKDLADKLKAARMRDSFFPH
ncbi:hypothetical protein Hdeb2414_s0016g00482111 [Helianthus debilis subsp. tardiflorus]